VTRNATEQKQPEPGGRTATRNGLVATGAVVLAAGVTGALLHFSEMPRETAFISGIFILAGALWVTESLPLFATALLIIGLQVVFLANPGGWHGLGFATGQSPTYREILRQAADPVLFLFFGGLVLARAAMNEGVGQAMAAVILGPFGPQPRWGLLGLMLITLFFSMWMSNTATAAMMLGLATPMMAAWPKAEPFRKAILLSVPFAANIGGMGTPVASPPNAVAISFLQRAGHSIAFLDWMLVAVPLMILLTGFTWWLLLTFFAPRTADLQLEHSRQPLTGRGKVVVAVFLVTVALWMSERWHGLPAPVVALLPPLILAGAGITTRADLDRLEWSTLILIAGGLSLGAGLQLTGFDRLAVQWLAGNGGRGLGLLVGLVVATLMLSSFMSNTAAATLILPIGISAAVAAGSAGGLTPVRVALSIALVASLAMALPVSTPPNSIAYACGEFTTWDMAKVGLLVGGLAALLIIAGGGLVLRFWGLAS
jgi:sodium-dependent dicarboxylate transporter 2/3/5